MKAIKRDLERKRRALSRAIQSSMGSRRDLERGRELLKDPYGNASLTHDDEVAAAVVELRARELGDVTRALEELEAGRYGTCNDCGRPIPEARLRVMPLATRCVACQARVEDLRRVA